MLAFTIIAIIAIAAFFLLAKSTFASVSYFKNLFKESGKFDLNKIPYAFYQEAIELFNAERNSFAWQELDKLSNETLTEKIEATAYNYFRLLLDNSNDKFLEKEAALIKKYNVRRAIIN